MNDVFKKMADAIKKIASTYYQTERELQEVRVQQLQQQQQQQLQQRTRQYIKSLMYSLTNDLFVALHGQNYSFIRPLSAPAEIRVCGYSFINGQNVYEFELTKTQTAVVTDVSLKQLRWDFNSDIELAQHHMVSVYGTQDFFMPYPFLYYGMRVVRIKDTGTAIRIGVVSNYAP